MFSAVLHPPLPMREPLVMARCPHQLWEGVRCTLPSGHKGSHFRAAGPDGSCELRWRSSPAR
jgi:hypothetical protein